LSEEKMMKYITLIFLLFVSTTALAGSGGGFAPGIVDHTPTKSEETPDNMISNKELCDKKGGTWHEGDGYKYCVIPYPDAGKLCKSSKDCVGHCTWPVDGKAMDDKPMPKGFGLCQLDDAINNCGRPQFENGKIIWFNCD
jgi:hypothetical protein